MSNANRAARGFMINAPSMSPSFGSAWLVEGAKRRTVARRAVSS